MEKNNHSPNSLFSQTAIISTSILMYTASVVTPALGEIAKAFPDASPQTIQLFATLPSLLMVIFALVSGVMTRYMSMKKVLLIALPLLGIGGILPAFFGGMNILIFDRFIYGIGLGLSSPICWAAISRFYQGAKESKMMGLSNAVGALSGSVLQILGGVLAVYNWRYPFLCFICILPVFILVLLSMPEEEVSKPDPAQKAHTEKVKKLTPLTYTMAAMIIVVNICIFSLMTNLSIVMDTEGIGNASQSGIIFTIFTIAAFIVGLLYNRIYAFTKNQTLTVGIGILAIAFIVLSFAQSYMAMCVASVIYGIGFGLLNTSGSMLTGASAAKPEYGPLAMSLYTSGLGIGQFVSPFVLGFISNLLGFSSLRSNWIVASVILIIITIGSLIGLKQLSKKPAVSGEF